MAGLEPAWPLSRQILSLMCIPIPPHSHSASDNRREKAPGDHARLEQRKEAMLKAFPGIDGNFSITYCSAQSGRNSSIYFPD